MQPALAQSDDLAWVSGNTDEDVLVKQALAVALANPRSNPAALVQELQNKVDERLLREIQRELHVLDEKLDFALAFEGARKQLKELMSKRQHAMLLDKIKEKSLSELTAEEKALLKSGRAY
jgi:DNA primase